MSFLKKLILYTLSFQEKMLTKNLGKTLSAKAVSKRKKYFQEGCLVSFDAVADSEKNKMEEELMLLLKTCNYSPEELLKFISSRGTKIFYIKDIKTINSIGETSGFIYPQRGFKALYLSLLTEKKFQLKTNEMFILTDDNINQYHFIYHLYNWYTFKHGYAGIDIESQELLNKYLYNTDDKDFSKLQLDDIYKLKDAIRQDKAAIDFVYKLCQKYESSKKAFKKMKDSNASI